MNPTSTAMLDESFALGEEIAVMAANLDAAMHRLLTALRTFEASGEWGRQGALSCAHWLSWRVGWSLHSARERVRVAKRLAELPLIDAALRAGACSFSKVRAMVRVATPENEAALVECAKYLPASHLESVCRKTEAVQRLAAQAPGEEEARRTCRRHGTDAGMVRIELVLRPEEAALVWKAIEDAADGSAEPSVSGSSHARRGEAPDGSAPEARHGTAEPSVSGTSHWSRADGVVRVAEQWLRGNVPDRPPVEVVVHIPEGTPGADPTSNPLDHVVTIDDGTVISDAVARRLCCDASKVEVDEHGNAGRRTRTVSPKLRRTITLRDRGCRFPGCTNHRFVDAHHIEHWVDGGATTKENLVLLCRRHHGFVHEHGYRVEMQHGLATFFHPRGWKVEHVPGGTRPRPEPPSPDITPATNACHWDDQPVQYEHVVSVLV